MKDLVKLVRAANPGTVIAGAGAASFVLLLILGGILHLRYAEEIVYGLTFVVGVMFWKVCFARTGRRRRPRSRGSDAGTEEIGRRPRAHGRARTRGRGRRAVFRHDSR
jgi:hypothetical protein